MQFNTNFTFSGNCDLSEYGYHQQQDRVCDKEYSFIIYYVIIQQFLIHEINFIFYLFIEFA